MKFKRNKFDEMVYDFIKIDEFTVERFLNKRLSENNPIPRKGIIDDGEFVLIRIYHSYEYWKSLKEALDFYIRALSETEGSEQGRYASIVTFLKDRIPFVWDDYDELDILHKDLFPEKHKRA